MTRKMEFSQFESSLLTQVAFSAGSYAVVITDKLIVAWMLNKILPLIPIEGERIKGSQDRPKSGLHFCLHLRMQKGPIWEKTRFMLCHSLNQANDLWLFIYFLH